MQNQITLTQCGAIISNIIGSLLTLLGVYMEGQICQKKIMWQIFDTKKKNTYRKDMYAFDECVLE